MAYNFLPYNQDQLFLLPVSIREWVSEGSLARFVSDVVDGFDEEGKLGGFYEQYRTDGWGRASYHPCLMLKVLLYGYALGMTSSRKFAQALEHDVAFRYLAANQQPDFRTISDFRKRHLQALEGLFATVVELCEQAGLVKLGVVAVDGRKVPGNASPRQNRTREQLAAEVRKYLRDVEETDRREDALYGPDRRGDELPEELRTDEGRRRKIRQLLAELDAEKAAAVEEQEQRVEAYQEAEAGGGKKRRGRKPKPLSERKLKKLDEKRRNLTDPDSRLMQRRGTWLQGYSGQALVDCTSQIIVAQSVTNEVNEHEQLPVLLSQCNELIGRHPKKCLADAGYWCEANGALDSQLDTDLYIAVERKTTGRKYRVSSCRKHRECGRSWRPSQLVSCTVNARPAWSPYSVRCGPVACSDS